MNFAAADEKIEINYKRGKQEGKRNQGGSNEKGSEGKGREETTRKKQIGKI